MELELASHSKHVLQDKHILQQKEAVQQANQQKNEPNPSVEPLLLAFMYIFQSVQISHETALIQGKAIQANALAENNLINEEAQINFITFSKSQLFTKQYLLTPYGHGKVVYKLKQLSTEIIQNWMAKNQEISAQRNLIGDLYNQKNQQNQQNETNENTVTDEDQQSVSEGSKLMSMLSSLSSQISRI